MKFHFAVQERIQGIVLIFLPSIPAIGEVNIPAYMVDSQSAGGWTATSPTRLTQER